MKDTLRIIKKNAIYLGKDALHALEDLLTLIVAMVLLVLQLIAWPFKTVIARTEDKMLYAKPSSITVEDVPVE